MDSTKNNLNKTIESTIYNHLFEPFSETKNQYIGVELEFPIVNLEKGPCQPQVVQHLMKFLIERLFFRVNETDKNQLIISVVNIYKDIISFEYSFNTLEFSLQRGHNINEVATRFYLYTEQIQDFLSNYNYTLTGLGIHPGFEKNNQKPLSTDYYEMLQAFFGLAANHKGFHHFTNFCSFVCSAQTHINIELEQLPKVLNFLNQINWIAALIFSNSAMFVPDLQRYSNVLCWRDFLWNKSMLGFHPCNYGLYGESLETIDDIYKAYLRRSMFYVKRKSSFIFFEPVSLEDFFLSESIAGFFINSENTIEKIKIHPQLEDISFFRSYKYFELTRNGTIEIRSECQQPIKEAFTPATFYLGAIGSMDAIAELLSKYKENKLSVLREAAITQGIFNFIEKNDLQALLFNVLNLTEEYLVHRGYNEEQFLIPLYKRIENLTCPAKDNINLLKNGYSIEEIIKYNQ